jgi:6-phosphofructokinase
MCGISMTIGADTALNRIVSAVDALVTYVNSEMAADIIS